MDRTPRPSLHGDPREPKLTEKGKQKELALVIKNQETGKEISNCTMKNDLA
jgi:hypothetical protein